MIDFLWKLLTNKSVPYGLRASLFILIVFFVIFIDLSFNVSYNIQNSVKLRNIERVNLLKELYANDSIKYAELLEIEENTFKTKHYKNYLFSIFDKKTKLSDNTSQQTTAVIKNTTLERKNLRSKFWMLISSNYFFVILLISLILSPFYDKSSRSLENILGTLSAMIILSCIMIVSTWTAYMIPLLFGLPVLNYILNVIIHTSILVLLYKLSKKK